jgi:glycosyltransferase involved in cell wall biosynthesis
MDKLYFLDGIYDLEENSHYSFRWTKNIFSIKIDKSNKHLSILIYSPRVYLENFIWVSKDDWKNSDKIPLIEGVNVVNIPLTGESRLHFKCNTFNPSEKFKSDDCRELGIQLIKFCLDGDIIPIEDVKFEEKQKPIDLTEMLISAFPKSLLKDDLHQIIETDNRCLNLEISPDEEFSGIVYVGQYGTSGYATAAKGNMFYFFNKHIPITWEPLYFDNSKMEDDCVYNVVVKSLINKKIKNVNTVVFHSTPDMWHELARSYRKKYSDCKFIGYTVWETDKLPLKWVENINGYVDEVWCPSTYNKEVFKNSGVRIPIKVFPHVFMPKELPDKKSICLNSQSGEKIVFLDDCYTFYNISELNPRKGVEDLVKVFCDSFSEKDPVRLILKVHYKNYSIKNKKYCVDILNDVILGYKNPPKIYYLLDNLTEKQILGLHSVGDCYVSLCKSEGFGLTIFESFKYGKKIIVTGYGGHLDFLGNDFTGLVKYTMSSVEGMELFSKNYTTDQCWANPDLKHASFLMKGI